MTKNEEYVMVPQKWEIPYKHSAGRVAIRFFNELKNKRIVGAKCPRCKRILVPPWPFCEQCFVALDEWFQVGEVGTIETFTICYEKFTGLPDPPYAIGGVKLEGADTSFVHFIGGVDLSEPEKALEKIRVGAKVRAVWREKTEGNILDIKYFEPI